MPGGNDGTMIYTFIGATILLSVVMAASWELQRATGNSGWVDAVWSFGLGAAGLVLALVPGGPTTRQMVVAGLIAAWSIRLGVHNPAPFFRPLDIAGIVVLIIAVAGEAVADEQLRRFKKNPANKGRVCDTGLWAWSRHPNYFFEWLGWVAYPLLAISSDWWWGWLALTGPAFMYWLLAHVSGVPMLEQQMLKSRGTAFRAYQSRVSSFFPLPPRG